MKTVSLALAAALLLLAAPAAFAWMYNASGTCDYGWSANGTVSGCEPMPMQIPVGCAFGLPDGAVKQSTEVAIRGSSCGGASLYISLYQPDTNPAWTTAIPCVNNTGTPNSTSTQTFGVVSGYGTILPPAQVQADLAYTLGFKCWDSSTELVQNGGFEASYHAALPIFGNQNRTLSDGGVIPGWQLYSDPAHALSADLLSDAWSGKTGSKYLYLNASSSAEDRTLKACQALQVPGDLGSLYNVSFNLETTTAGSVGGNISDTRASLTFADNSTVALINMAQAGDYNGTFSTVLNLGGETGQPATLCVEHELLCPSWCAWTGSLKLDTVSMNATCAGLNCTQLLMSPVTTTTTTLGPGGSTGGAVNGLVEYGINFIAGAVGTDIVGSQLLIWTALTMVVFFGTAYAEVSTSKDLKLGSNGVMAPLVLSLIFFMVGGVVQTNGVPFVPMWLDITIIVVAGLMLASTLGHVGGKG